MAEQKPAAADSSSPSLAAADSAREEVLDRMLTRLALSDDSKLQTLLAKLLPDSISCLASSSPSIRNKVLEILSHVNKRVKHQVEIRLPLLDLWKMFTDISTSPMVKNFCIIYIEMAFDRLLTEEKADMAPELISNLSRLSPSHQNILLRIVSKVIGECHSRAVSGEIGAKYRVMAVSEDGQIFVEFCLHTVLYHPPSHGMTCPHGLSPIQSDRVTGKLPVTAESLLTRKLGILNVLEAMEPPPEHVYPIYLAACSDSQEPVAKRGEELLKKKTSAVNLEDKQLINRLFSLFIGTTGVEAMPADSRVTPVNHALKARFMQTFCRSIAAANAFPHTLQCIFSCIYGAETNPRLKQSGMEFSVWVFRHAKDDQLKLMGPVILATILRSLDGNIYAETDVTTRDVKAFAFQAIGLLAERLPSLFREKTDMAVRMFGALKEEDQFLRTTIQEATNSLAVAYKGAPQVVLKELEELLLQNSLMEQSEVRFCAVRWATFLYSMQHCPSRFICMLGAGDPKLDIREMALAGLFPVIDQNRNVDLKYPDLKDMVEFISKQHPKLLEPTETRSKELLFSPKVYLAMISFILKSFEEGNKCSISLRETSENCSSVVTLCLLLEHAMAYDGSVELHATASKGLVTVGYHYPKLMASRYAGRIAWLRQLLSHVDSDTRESASRLMGMACFALSTSDRAALLSELISDITASQKLKYETQHGIIGSIGYVAAECMSGPPSISEKLLVATINCMVDLAKSESAALASIAMEALGHIGLRCRLPGCSHDGATAGILVHLRERLAKFLSGNDSKVAQKIVISIGHMSTNETSSDLLHLALDLIFSLGRCKVEEVLFAAGEALSFIWGEIPVTVDMILKSNYSSLSLSSNYLSGDTWTISETKYTMTETDEIESRVKIRDSIFRKLFDVLLYSSRKEERCAGAVWLLSLTMYNGQHYKIQQQLPDIQEAFSHLLGDQNDLTQELASQGMSFVYELGDSAMKNELVNALVGTLTGSGKRKRVVKLMEDSEVFQEGSIGESITGGKLSTYKELCNLANEMGQPDLIYKFMDLANYQASLNSKRGAAFGFSKIAKQAGDALLPHLRILIPRLVRYQYDPDKNVQEAMGHIWKSLVDDPKRAVDEHFDLIIDDLLTQCGSRLWRVREASCFALADVIQGRKLEQVSKHLKGLWVAAFRAMDDIKETVRNSGDSLCRAVNSLTIRLCDVSLTPMPDASQAMNIVLPFLLSEGIVSKVASVQKASITVVMKLSKGAGAAIRPHLSNLVCCMLECLSSLEDQRLNYVELHAENVGIQMEKLENLRIAVAKDSPMWATLDLCLRVVDSKSLEELVPRLSQLVRSGVGLNTRVGVASFIVLLIQKVGSDIKPHTGMLLKLLFPAVINEKSWAAKRAFAGACAMVFKHTTLVHAQKLIDDTIALQIGDKNSQLSCGILMKNYSNLAFDVVSGYHAVIYPVIFAARFGDDKDVKKLFDDLWEETTNSERATLQLYLAEIVSLLCEGIASSSWAVKKKSAKAIEKLCEVLGESVSSFQLDLLKCLLKEIPGRLWEGKEAILNAIAALCTASNKAVSGEEPITSNSIVTAVLAACTKKSKSYREAAFSCLKQVIEAFNNPDFFGLAFPFILDECNRSGVKKAEEVSFTSSGAQPGEVKTEGDVPTSLDKVVDCMTSLIRVAHPHDVIVQGKDFVHVILHALSPGFSWTVKMSAFSLIREFSSKLSHSSAKDEESSSVNDHNLLICELIDCVVPQVIECIKTVKIGQVHVAASECLLHLFGLSKSISFPKGMNLTDELIHLCEIEKSEQAKSLLKKCVDLLGEVSVFDMQT